MTAFRVSLRLAAAASLIPFAFPAAAQVPDDVVVNILRECAKIGDATARLACYDNNIRQAGGSPSTRATQIPQGGSASVPTAPAQTFGLEDVRTPRAPQESVARQDEIQARVNAVREVQPGMYRLTMDDGTQWRFSEGVSQSYRVPRSGSTVEIERGSLGSYLLRFDRQQAVGVVRER